MQIEITQKQSVALTEKRTIEAPAFFRLKHTGMIGVYSEKKVVEVKIWSETVSVLKMTVMQSFGSQHAHLIPDLMEEMTEDEFNDQLSKALFMIAGVEACPTLELQPFN